VSEGIKNTKKDFLQKHDIQTLYAKNKQWKYPEFEIMRKAPEY
jgi:hypothetical protein